MGFCCRLRQLQIGQCRRYRSLLSADERRPLLHRHQHGRRRKHVHAGVSFKFGSSNEYSNYSKASLATVVSEQASTIGSLNARVEKQEQENEALRAQVEKQAQENAELRTQVQDILRQLANK